MIYSFMQNLYPVSLVRKARREGDLLLATNQGLDLVYLNETSAFFLERANGRNTVQDIVNEMLSEYAVDLSVLQEDTCHLIRDLQWDKLVKLARTPKS